MRYFPTLVFLLLFACKTQKPSQQLPTLSLAENKNVVFLDSTAAATAIIKDETEDFFKHINILDMSIQIKKAYPEGSERSEVLADYKAYLQKDVESFTASEIVFVNNTFKKLYELCQLVSADIFPKEIKLIKTKAKHYGQSVYYTRENCIVIPYNELDQRNEDAFLNVMIHELFHVYSRLNPEKRKELYELIGFKSIGPLDNLNMVDSLKRRVLLNPDGVNYAQAITLKTNEKESLTAIPIILTNSFEFKPERPQFFSYIQFDLYEIRPPYSRLIKVVSNNDGSNKRQLSSHPDFHRQIRDNTGYIIHPDEVLADNFIYVLLSQKDKAYSKRFSEAGQALIQQIEAILKK